MKTPYLTTRSKSDVAHKPNDVFAAAKRGYVLLRERSGENFVIVSEAIYQQDLRGQVEAAQVLALAQVSPDQFSTLPGYAWTEALSVAERANLRNALILGLRPALEAGSWDAYDRALESWQATADALSNPELTAELLADWDEADELALCRP